MSVKSVSDLTNRNIDKFTFVITLLGHNISIKPSLIRIIYHHRLYKQFRSKFADGYKCIRTWRMLSSAKTQHQDEDIISNIKACDN